MAKARSEAPTVSTFGDHEVIIPASKLHKAIKVSGAADFGPDLEAIERAEAALAELSTEFAGWMRSECDRLDAARLTLREDGLTSRGRTELFRAAHDIKGQAATFGYPLAAEAANSLCRLIEHSPDFNRVPLALIDQHVDGVRAIIREDIRETGNAIAAALANGLRQVTDDYLIQVNKHRPEYLEGIITFAPPLVPAR